VIYVFVGFKIKPISAIGDDGSITKEKRKKRKKKKEE